MNQRNKIIIRRFLFIGPCHGNRTVHISFFIDLVIRLLSSAKIFLCPHPCWKFCIRIIQRIAVSLRIPFIPDNSSQIIRLAKYFPAYFLQITYLILIHIDKDQTILRKQISRKQQSGIHHGTPVRMISSGGFAILSAKINISIFIKISRPFSVFFPIHDKRIGIYKIMTGIIRGININELYRCQITFLK